VTQWLGAGQRGAAPDVQATDSPLPLAPDPGSLGPATGPLPAATASFQVLASSGGFDIRGVRDAAASRRLARSPKSRSVVRHPAATPAPVSQVASSAPLAQTRLPVGGATAGSGGGIGSVAPLVVATFEALALALGTILLARLSLDRATWRSALLASRLEHPD
jgi:hypothetical protein